MFEQQRHAIHQAAQRGPGSALSAMLSAVKIPQCARCKDTAEQMDQLGVHGCLARRTELVRSIAANIARHPKSLIRAVGKLPAPMVESLIAQAFDRAVELASEVTKTADN